MRPTTKKNTHVLAPDTVESAGAAFNGEREQLGKGKEKTKVGRAQTPTD